MTVPGRGLLLHLGVGLLVAVARIRWPSMDVLLAGWILVGGFLTARSLAMGPRIRQVELWAPSLPPLRPGTEHVLEVHLVSNTPYPTNLEFVVLPGFRLAVLDPPPRLVLPGGETHTVSVRIRAVARGGYPAVSGRLVMDDGWSWLVRHRTVDLAPAGAVLPALPSAQVIRAMDRTLGPVRRDRLRSRDRFAGLRRRLPGEGTRDLSWSATARTGRPMVRLWESTRPDTSVVVLDVGAGMGVRSGRETCRLDHACGLAEAMLGAGDRLGRPSGLLTWSTRAESWIPPGTRTRQRSLAVLASCRSMDRPSDPKELVAFLRKRLPAGGRVVLLTEPDGDPERWARALRALARSHAVEVVAVGDPVLRGRLFAPVGTEGDAWCLAATSFLWSERLRALRSFRAAGARLFDAGTTGGRELRPPAPPQPLPAARPR